MIRKIKHLWYTILYLITYKELYFWKMVSYAYNPKIWHGHYGICGYSKLFENRWRFNRTDILGPAEIWLKDQDLGTSFHYHVRGFLFYFKIHPLQHHIGLESSEHFQKMMDIRKRFIKHMIEECKKN